MASLAMFLLGPPRLERDGAPLQFDTRKIMALAAYVAMTGPASRDALMAMLWPELEPSRAQGVLRRNLSLLKKALGGEWLLIDRQEIAADPAADFTLDVARFRRLAQAGAGPDRLAALEEAAALYRGDFMEGWTLRDSVQFDDWQFFEAEALRQELAVALDRLAGGYLAQVPFGDAGPSNPQAALPHARRRLALDPLHEPAHRQLMALYAQMGQRSAALRQYRECARILDEELGLAPDAETAALHDQIRAGLPAAGGALWSMPGPPAPAAAHNTWAARPGAGLPAQTTPFIGRRRELAEVRARLEDPGCRLLTLLGPGGVGKTRLALRAAEELAHDGRFKHGVFFCPLATVACCQGVIPAVAEALGFQFRPETEGRSQGAPRGQLIDYMRRKQLLLVLDNYEHLLPAPARAYPARIGRAQAQVVDDASPDEALGLIADLLAAAPGVKLLVTSRASLQVQGEHLYPVQGLQAPPGPLARMGSRPVDPVDEPGLAVRLYSAVELFRQGAQQVSPGYELRAEDLAPVAHICRLVEGMPLGILLAAAWVEVLSPAEIAAEIERSLDFLETGRRDAPARQRSIRAVFDYSWRLLDERERDIFCGLAVFAGTFSHQAALDVAGATPRDLLSLANKSFVQPMPGQGRYGLHELLRQYAAGRLDGGTHPSPHPNPLPEGEGGTRPEGEGGTRPEGEGGTRPDGPPERKEPPPTGRGAGLHDRHCAYYSAALERWAADLKGARQREAMEELDQEIDNARAAWLWAAGHGQIDRLAQGIDGLAKYYTWRVRFEEGETAMRAAVQGLEAAAGDDSAARRLWARALALWGNFRIEQGKKEPGAEAVRRALAAAGELEAAGHDARSERALALHSLAVIKRYFYPDPHDAEGLCRQAIALYEQVGDRWGMARSLDFLGILLEDLGRFREAQACCEQSLAIGRELGDRRGMAGAMLDLGVIAWVQGRLDEAMPLLEEAAGLYRSLDDWSGLSWTIKSLGELLMRRGMFDDGLIVLESGIQICDELGDEFGMSAQLPFVAEARIHLGQYAEALADTEQVEEIVARFPYRWTRAFNLFLRGLTLLGARREGALDLLRQAAAGFEEVNHDENRAWVAGPLGLAAHLAGDEELAGRSVREALQTGLDMGVFMPLMYGLPAAARLLAARGDAERAVEVYACAARSGFVANSRWFQDLTAGPVAEAAAGLGEAALAAARRRGEETGWEEMARRVVDLL